MKKRNAPAITWITTFALLLSMCAGLTFSQRTAAQSENPNAGRTDVRYPTLSQYATDLTLLALQGKLPRTNERDADIDRVIASLASAQKTPVLVGESDLDRNIVARGVALKLALGDAPDALRTRRVFSLRLDTLAKDAKTSDEFASRAKAVFAEVAQAQGQIILFVDQLDEYAGKRANAITSAAIREAIEANRLSIIGGAAPEAYSSDIANTDVAKLFEPLSIDGADDSNSSAIAEAKDKRRSPINEEFEGEKISSDMQSIIDSVGPNGRVTAILQVDDVNNPEVVALLKRYDANVDARMAQLGAIKVELPAKAIAALAKIDGANYISSDVKLESFGHVTVTTGTTQVRNAPGLIAGLLGASAIDGAGVGIAILDSGLDTAHEAFTTSGTRIKFSKDFTGENNTTSDPYGHGSHVASSAAAKSYSDSDRYEGIAPGATIINLRVLNSLGTGTTSALLAAMNWIVSPVDPTKAVSSTNPLNRVKYNIRIVNMSLGAPAISSYKDDPICRAARALVDAGIVVVAAAVVSLLPQL